MDEIKRRNMMKLAAISGVGTSLLSALGSKEAAAVTGDTPETFSDSVTHVLNTGNIVEPAVTQASTIGWYVPSSGEDDNYWTHKFAISTTSTGWNRRSSDGSFEKKAANLSDQHWDLDMSGTSLSSGGDFTHYTMNDEKYCGFHPHPDGGNKGLEIAEIIFDTAIGAINAPVGAALVADDLIQIMTQDVSKGLNDVTNGFTFHNKPDGYHKQMVQSHRIAVEVPYDVNTEDQVKITTWTGGEAGTQVTFTLNFTYYADTAPYEPSSYEPDSEVEADSGYDRLEYEPSSRFENNGADPNTPTPGEGANPETPATLNPRKMSKKQKNKYGIKKVPGDKSSPPKFIATNLPLNVEIETKRIGGSMA